MNYVILAMLIVVGGFNIGLSLEGHPTISQRYQKLFPTWLDMIILALVLIVLCFLPIHPALKVWIASLCGHICWPNKERYNK